jgi:hypothetical protein
VGRLQKGVEFGDYGEGSAYQSDGFAKLLNLCGFHVAEHSGGAGEIVHFFGAKAHDAAGGGIGRHGIVAEDENTGGLGISLNWAIPFHTEDTIDDDEIGAGGGVDVEDGAVDAGPVENVFGPAIATSGNDAEKIFHGERDAGPVVRFELGHGHEKVDAKNGFGQIEVLEERGAGFEFNALDIVNVEVAEVAARSVAEGAGEFGEADGFKNGPGVAVERGAIADEHASGAKLEKTLPGGGDDGGMGVHGADRIVADEIGFEEDGFVFDGEAKFLEAFVEDGEEVFFVAGDFADEHAGWRSGERRDELTIAEVHGCKRRLAQRREGAEIRIRRRRIIGKHPRQFVKRRARSAWD